MTWQWWPHKFVPRVSALTDPSPFIIEIRSLVVNDTARHHMNYLWPWAGAAPPAQVGVRRRAGGRSCSLGPGDSHTFQPPEQKGDVFTARTCPRGPRNSPVISAIKPRGGVWGNGVSRIVRSPWELLWASRVRTQSVWADSTTAATARMSNWEPGNPGDCCRSVCHHAKELADCWCFS